MDEYRFTCWPRQQLAFHHALASRLHTAWVRHAGRSMTRAILHSVATQIAGLALSFAVSVLSARILLPNGRADLALYNFTLLLLSGLFGFGTASSTVYFRARGEIGLSRIAMIVAAQCAISVCACVLALSLDFGHGALEFVPRAPDNFFLYLLMIHLPILFASQTVFALLVSEQYFYFQNYLALATNGLLLASCIWLYAYTYPPDVALKIFLTLTAAGNALIAGIGWMSYRKSPLSRPNTEEQVSTLDYFRYGAASAGADFLQNLAYRADIWLVLYFLGKNALGQHAVAVALAQTLWALPQAATAIIFPSVSRGAAQFGEVARWARLSLFAAGSAAAIAALAAPCFFPMVYGREFGASATVFLWLMPGIVIFVASKIYASYLGGEGLASANLMASSLGSFAGLLFAIALIPLWGLPGAGLAASISYGITTAAVLAAVRRKTGFSIVKLLILQPGDFGQFAGRKFWLEYLGLRRNNSVSDGEIQIRKPL
jgi:O-antigen/teichoic acid export membrane protein